MTLRIRSGAWIQAGYVFLDILFVSITAFLSLCLRFGQSSTLTSRWFWSFSSDLPLREYGALLLVYATLTVLICQSRHLYRTVRTRTAAMESLAVAWAVTSATLLLMAFVFVSGIKVFSRLVVLSSGVLSAATLIAWRLARRRFVAHRITQGVGVHNALIVGAGSVGQLLGSYLGENPILGYKVKGYLDGNQTGEAGILGRIEDFERVARAEFIDEVFITIPSEREIVKRVASEARKLSVNVKVVPELYDGLGWNAPIHRIGDFPLMDLHSKPIPILGLFFKRILDVVVAVPMLIVVSPLLAALAMAIKYDSPGPVLYRSVRIGRKGSKFSCYKFRTMVINADRLKDELRSRNEREGPFFKIADDPRITNMGRFLRKYSLDELPQLWNVIRGDMSLVGPRPHPLDDYERYDLEHLRRLDVKPGITGLWQVTARRDPSFEKNMELDLAYIDNWHIGRDLLILFRTVPHVLRALGD